MKIDKEISENNSLLIIVSGQDYRELVNSTAKTVAKEGSVCYITLNKTSESLKESFSKKDVDLSKIIFIDAITRTISEGPMQNTGVYFVKSPAALTDISILVDKMISHNFKFFILDSISTLMVYQKADTVIKFLSYLITKAEQTKTKVVIYALDIKEHKQVLDECSMSVEKVLNYKG